MSENFKNFELRFHDYCIQADYRNLAKNPETERADYYKKPLLEMSALRSAMPDEALQVIRYTIEPQIAADDQKKPWIWMEKLRLHYTGSIGSSLLADRFKFWNTQQSPHESVQKWEVKVRQTGSLCSYNALTDEMCRDKFVFGLHDGTMRAELLKTHLKSDGMPQNMQDVVAEAKALESAQKANKLITDATKGIEEQVNWISHKLKLRVGGEATEHLAAGSNQNPLVNKTYICCRWQMVNTPWNTTLMTTKNSVTPWKHGKYTASTRTTQRKNTLLHCPCLQQGTNSPQ